MPRFPAAAIGAVIAAVALLSAPAAAPAAGDRFEAVDAALAPVLSRFAIPGAVLVFARDGVVLHARGFGYADVATQTPVTPKSLFLVASVSKTLTAMAVLKLVEDRKLALDDKAFSYFRDLQAPPGTTRDPRLDDITIRDLLDHSGGWDRKLSSEPAGQIAKIHRALGTTGDPSPLDVIRYALSLPLDFAPGTRSAYSNFGFILAGQIVERVSGESYEHFVRENVLVPAGVTDAAISHVPEPLPGEVLRYDGAGRQLPNGTPAATSSAGGWILSALDYVKIFAALEDGKILNRQSLETMLAGPYPPLAARPNGTAFGLGWDDVSRDPQGRLAYSKDGSLPGIRTWVEHRADGLDEVLFLNGSGVGAGPAAPEAQLKAARAAIDGAL